MYEWAITLSGWAGMILILLSYLLITAGKITANTKVYQLLNFIGSSFFIFHKFFTWVIRNFFLISVLVRRLPLKHERDQ